MKGESLMLAGCLLPFVGLGAALLLNPEAATALGLVYGAFCWGAGGLAVHGSRDIEARRDAQRGGDDG